MIARRGTWVAATVAVAVLIAGCVVAVLPSTPGRPLALGDVGIIEPPLSAPTGEAYVYEGYDGALLFSRPRGDSSFRQYLGRAMTVSSVSSSVGAREFVTYNRSATLFAESRGRTSLVSRFATHDSYDGLLLTTKRDAYVTWNGGVTEVSLASGTVAHEFSTPVLPSHTRGFEMSPPPTYVTSVVPDGRNLFALEDNTEVSAIVNLTTHAQRSLPGIALVPDAVLASDGYIYVFGWTNEATTTMRVLRIDPETLAVASDFVVDAHHLLNFDRVQMQALRGGGVVVFVTSDLQNGHGSVAIVNDFWRVSHAGVVALSLPARGLDMSVFGDVAYIYGGANGNVVSSVNLVTGAERRVVPGLTTAAGTYVESLV